MHARRPILSVIGSSGDLPDEVHAMAKAVGCAAVDAGFRVASGGRDGVMAAVSEGARSSPAWIEGTIVGVLPSYDTRDANAYVDIVIPTGLGFARNTLVVAMADVVVAIAGASGTLSEMALAWQLRKPVIALASTGGWAARLAGERLDERLTRPVRTATDPGHAIELARSAISVGVDPPLP